MEEMSKQPTRPRRCKLLCWSILIAFVLLCVAAVSHMLIAELRPSPDRLFKLAVMKPIPKSVAIHQAAAEGQIVPTDWIFLHFDIGTNDLAQLIANKGFDLKDNPVRGDAGLSWWEPEGQGYQNHLEKRGYWARRILSMWVKNKTNGTAEVWLFQMQED